MDYDIAFLSFIIPKDMNDEVRSKSINRMEDAAIAWQEHIVSGIEENNGSIVKMINVLPVEAYPRGYKEAIIDRVSFSHTQDAHDVNIGFCNVKIIKRMIQWMPLYREVDQWVKHDSGKRKVLIGYTMYPEFMSAISHIKRKCPEIITISIVVDLPQFIALGEEPLSYLQKKYQKWSKKQAENHIRDVDGFAVITKQMGDLLCKNGKYVVIEGISTKEFPKLKERKDGRVEIIYAGLLHKKFGIIKLLDAFEMIEDKDFYLTICGIGESEEEILERSGKNNRIKYLGMLPRESVLDIMAGCDIIVNPRENNGEYTKYSFPSKNLEALSSGIPFIGYKLDGIPDEYDTFMNYPVDDSVKALSECIYAVGKSERNNAIEKARMAKEWVMSKKAPANQGRKIIELIEHIEQVQGKRANEQY